MPDPKPKWQEIADGLYIMAKYGHVRLLAEHEELYAGPDPTTMSEEDRAALKELHWRESEGLDCWQMFV